MERTEGGGVMRESKRVRRQNRKHRKWKVGRWALR
jgi:hypothetical protein